MRWSFLPLLVLGLLACDRESLTKIEYGPLVAVEAQLAESVLEAGGRTSVTCVLKAEPGLEVLDPESYETYVEAVEGLEVVEHTIGGTVPGEYEVRCGVHGQTSIDKIPDQLTIEPAEARGMVLRVDPDQSYYRIGDEVEVEALVLDEFDNVVRGLEEHVRWTVPGTGLNELDSEPGIIRFAFAADGEYPISARLGSPHDLTAPERILICDSAAPSLVLYTPERGETLDGETISVTGEVGDEMSGLASLTINDAPVDVAGDGSFQIDLSPNHGLNHVMAVALDEAGNRAEAQSSVYHSEGWRPMGDGFDPDIADGLGVHLSQAVIDSGSRTCAEAADGSYLCDAYEDMATMVEVLLNNMDLTAMAEGPVYTYGPILLTEDNLGSTSIDTPGISGMLDSYRIHGSFILRGDYTITANVVSVERGRAVMGDRSSGILGLTSTTEGLDLLAYVRPQGDREHGLTVRMEIRLDVDTRLFLSVDKAYDPDNGVWNLNTGEDVTGGACDDLGALDLIDWGLNFLGYSSNFRGYICLEEPLAYSYPSAVTGSDISFDRMKLAGRLLFDTTDEGLVDVTLQTQPGQPLIDFLGEDVAVDSDEEIIIDLSSVEIVGGWMTVDLGEYSLGSPLELLDPVLTTLLTELQLLVSLALEDMIVCEGSLSGCPLDVEGLIEEIFNSLAARDLAMTWPAVMPEGPEMMTTISQYFSSISFGATGGWMGFDNELQAERRLHESVPEPRGTMLRGGCAGRGALAAVPADRHMSTGFDLDLVNQALAAGWYNGGLAGMLEPASGGSIDSLEVELQPMLPPVFTACAGRDELE
ncbi:MAG: hypothetical protein ACOC0J_02235, partial [Myxococcota bacterium]